MPRMTRYHNTRCVEKKFHDVSESGTGGGVGEFIGLVGDDLTGIAQNNTAEGRNGNKIFVYNEDLTMTFDASGSNGACNLVRVIMFVDKQSNGNKPTLEEVLGSASATPTDFRNLENQARFRFLHDRLITVDNTGGGGAAFTGGCKILKKRVGFSQAKGGLRVQYETGTSTGYMDTIKDNNIWVLVLANNTNVTWTLRSRARYSD